MIFICYEKCSTCKKAKNWLIEHNINYDEREIKTNNPSYDELKTWHEVSKLPIKRFFNTSGMIYKSMQLKDKLPDMTLDEQLRLLATNGMLVKRPILVSNNFVKVGFKIAEWEDGLLQD